MEWVVELVGWFVRWLIDGWLPRSGMGSTECSALAYPRLQSLVYFTLIHDMNLCDTQIKVNEYIHV